LTFKCDLDLWVTTQFLRSAHRLIIVITCVKFFQKKISGLKVMERKRKCYGWTKEQTDWRTYGERLCGRGLNKRENPDYTNVDQYMLLFALSEVITVQKIYNKSPRSVNSHDKKKSKKVSWFHLLYNWPVMWKMDLKPRPNLPICSGSWAFSLV
jgi:hypothetical protein